MTYSAMDIRPIRIPDKGVNLEYNCNMLTTTIIFMPLVYCFIGYLLPNVGGYFFSTASFQITNSEVYINWKCSADS